MRMTAVNLSGRRIQTVELRNFENKVTAAIDVLVGMRRRGSAAPGQKRHGHVFKIDRLRLGSSVARMGPQLGVTDWGREGESPVDVAASTPNATASTDEVGGGGGGGGDNGTGFVTHNPLMDRGGARAAAAGGGSGVGAVMSERTSSRASLTQTPPVRRGRTGGKASRPSLTGRLPPSRAPIVSASSGRSLTAAGDTIEPPPPVFEATADEKEVMAARRLRVQRASRESVTSLIGASDVEPAAPAPLAAVPATVLEE